jgi:hypothetical protein
MLVEGIAKRPFVLLEVGEMLHFLATALLLLIGIELVETLEGTCANGASARRSFSWSL